MRYEFLTRIYAATSRTDRVDQLLVDHVLNGSCHRPGRDGVDSRPGQTEETVVAAILEEAGAEPLRELNGLTGNGNVGDSDGIGVDVARCRRAIDVTDVPGTGRFLGSGGLGGVIDVVTLGVPLDVGKLGAV